MSALSLQGVCKSFGVFKALDHVTLSARSGGVLAVLGENGAGKTTLMNVLYGLYRPDAGEVRVDDIPVTLGSPRDAIANGIGMIHQHFHLAAGMGVVENVVAGLERGLRPLALREHERRIAELCSRFDFDVDMRSPVGKLPMGMRQRAEIVKALYRRARILVLDEPTSVLTPSEVKALLDSLVRLKAAGTTVLFVTHKMDEVFAIADDVAVMRQGRVVATRAARDTSARELAQLMMGRELAPGGVRQGTAAEGGVVLRASGLSARNDQGTRALDDVTLEVRGGEIVGITGVDGNGQRELAETVAGLRSAEAGSLEVRGCDITRASVRERVHEHRVGFVPEDRHASGLVLRHAVWANFFLRNFYRRPQARLGVLQARRMRREAARLTKEYDCRLRDIEQPVAELSGGNQQKIILAREIEAQPQLLVVMQATKGLDLGAIEFVQRKLVEQRDRGVAILYISTELEHVLELSDRVAVMHRGRLSSTLPREQATAERIGLLMAGAREEAGT